LTRISQYISVESIEILKDLAFNCDVLLCQELQEQISTICRVDGLIAEEFGLLEPCRRKPGQGAREAVTSITEQESPKIGLKRNT
jgi:hypothetical protein